MKLAGLKRTASEEDRRATVEQKLKKEKNTPAMLYGDTYLSDFEKVRWDYWWIYIHNGYFDARHFPVIIFLD